MITWNNTFMAIARAVASHSKDPDKQVGCVVVKNGNILSFGFNGTPHGFDNRCKDDNGKTLPSVVHAEANAIVKCAKSTQSIEGSSVYCTLAPCIECAKLLVQCGVQVVYFAEIWKDPAGIKLLSQANIQVTQIS